MARTRDLTVRVMAFLAVFILINLGIEWTSLWSRWLRVPVDSISLATGVGSGVVQNLLVGLAAYLGLQILLAIAGALRSLAGERRREAGMADLLPRHDGGGEE